MTEPNQAQPAGDMGVVARAIRLLLALGAGLALGLAVLEHRSSALRVYTAGMAAAAVALLACVAASRRASAGRLSALLAVGAASFALLLAEAVCRVTHHDVEGTRALVNATPIFFRKPDVPIGEAFFRRPGPASWTGQVQNAYYALIGVKERVADEPTLTIDYDADGLRNPPDLRDWAVAVAGDSFVELGHMPADELTTTQLGKLLRVPVKNLGVASTGNFSALAYLTAFGKAPSTRDTVLVFYEGNDLSDDVAELDARARVRSGGPRPTREIAPGDSILKAVARRFARKSDPYAIAQEGDVTLAGKTFTAHFRFTTTTVGAVGAVGGREETALRTALDELAALASKQGVRPWVVFMPMKLRVLYGKVVFPANAKRRFADWKPDDLPEHVKALARERHMGVIDPTARLTATAEAGVMPYFALYDSHLNRDGARVVAEVMAEALGAARP